MTSAVPPAESLAAWLPARAARLEVRPAPTPSPAAGEVVVRARAVAVNPVDWVIQVTGGLGYGWLDYPAVLGFDVAGDVLAVGADVTRVRPGDRVLGLAMGVEKGHRAAEGGFQQQVVLQHGAVVPLPAELSYEDACVVPLATATAACGLFQTKHLGLRHPAIATAPAAPTESVLVWGGSTSVGGNAVQLAVAAGYDVVSTASPRNADAVRRLGAREVVDHRDPNAVADAVTALRGRRLAGALAVGKGSAEACSVVLAASEGRRVVAVATGPVSFESFRRSPVAVARTGTQLVSRGGAQLLRDRRRGVRSAFIWGASLLADEVGPALFERYLPAALASGDFRPWPPPQVVGHGLDHLPEAFEVQRRGVSARKVVVTL